jgi:hypothetical protein
MPSFNFIPPGPGARLILNPGASVPVCPLHMRWHPLTPVPELGLVSKALQTPGSSPQNPRHPKTGARFYRNTLPSEQNLPKAKGRRPSTGSFNP